MIYTMIVGILVGGGAFSREYSLFTMDFANEKECKETMIQFKEKLSPDYPIYGYCQKRTQIKSIKE